MTFVYVGIVCIKGNRFHYNKIHIFVHVYTYLYIYLYAYSDYYIQVPTAYIEKPVSKTMLIYKKAARLRRSERKNTKYLDTHYIYIYIFIQPTLSSSRTVSYCKTIALGADFPHQYCT